LNIDKKIQEDLQWTDTNFKVTLFIKRHVRFTTVP